MSEVYATAFGDSYCEAVQNRVLIERQTAYDASLCHVRVNDSSYSFTGDSVTYYKQ